MANTKVRHSLTFDIKEYKELSPAPATLLGSGVCSNVYKRNGIAVKFEEGVSLETLVNCVTVPSLISHPFIIDTQSLSISRKCELWNIKTKMECCTPLVNLLDSGVSPATIHKWIGQLVTALTVLEENGVIHGDIKPQNIVINDAGNLSLIDFGIITCEGFRQEYIDNNTITQSHPGLKGFKLRGRHIRTSAMVTTYGYTHMSNAMFALGSTIYCMLKQIENPYNVYENCVPIELYEMHDNIEEWIKSKNVPDISSVLGCPLAMLLGRSEFRPKSFKDLCVNFETPPANHNVTTYLQPPYPPQNINTKFISPATRRIYKLGVKRGSDPGIINMAVDMFYRYLLPICVNMDYTASDDELNAELEKSNLIPFAEACLVMASVGDVEVKCKIVNAYTGDILSTFRGQFPKCDVKWDAGTSLDLLYNCICPGDSPIYGRLNFPDVDENTNFDDWLPKNLPDACPDLVVIKIGSIVTYYSPSWNGHVDASDYSQYVITKPGSEA